MNYSVIDLMIKFYCTLLIDGKLLTSARTNKFNIYYTVAFYTLI